MARTTNEPAGTALTASGAIIRSLVLEQRQFEAVPAMRTENVVHVTVCAPQRGDWEQIEAHRC